MSESTSSRQAGSPRVGPFYIISGLSALILSVTFLYLLESRRSTTLELARAGLVIYWLAGLGRRFFFGGGGSAEMRALLLRSTSLHNLVLIAAALLIAVSCLEGFGYRHRQLVMLVKGLFYLFLIYLQRSKRSPGEIGVFLIIAQLLLPFTSAFFTWNSYIQPPLIIALLLFVYELLRREENAPASGPHWFDFALGAYVFWYVLLLPTTGNYQDALLRLNHFAILLGLYILLRRFFYGPRRRNKLLAGIVLIGSAYTVTTLVLQLLFVLDLPYGWPIDKTRKGQLITTQIAQHFMVMAPLSLLTVRRSAGWRGTLPGLFLAGASILCLLFTLARGSIGGLGLSVMLCFTATIFLRNRRLLKYGLIFGLLMALGTGALFYFSDNNDLKGLFTVRQRMGLWYQAFHLFLADPLTGTGAFISFNLFSLQVGDPDYAQLIHEVVIHTAPWIAPHNLYLALLLSGGIVAFLLFFTVLGGAVLTLGKVISRAGTSRSLQAFLFGVILLSFPIVGISESLISTPIPNFLIWIVWALFALYFGRALALMTPRPLRALAGKLPGASVLNAGRLILLAACVLVSSGNFLLYSGGVPISAIQNRITGLLVLEPDIVKAQGPGVHERLDEVRGRLEISRYFVPYDWRPHQLLGEIALIDASRRPDESRALTIEAAEHYRSAIRRNPNFPLLYLRLDEIYGYHEERAGEASFSAEREAARSRAAGLDPHFSYRRFWENPEAKID